MFKKESTRRLSNRQTKALYWDLHHFANFCATVLNIFSKETILTTTNAKNKFWSSYETLSECTLGNKTDDRILPAFAQFLLTLKFAFPSSYKKYFLVSFQAINLLENARRIFNFLNITIKSWLISLHPGSLQ